MRENIKPILLLCISEFPSASPLIYSYKELFLISFLSLTTCFCSNPQTAPANDSLHGEIPKVAI